MQRQATYLSELWHRLSVHHIALGCSCSMSGVSVTIEDFERDIADYLWAESERHGETRVLAFLRAAGALSEQERAVRSILSRLQDDDVEDAVGDWLSSRLTKTLESYARLHGPAPAAPLLGGAPAWRTGYRG